MDRLHRIKVGVLTSSRADFGIYIPLLLKLFNNESIDCEIIAFGSHLSERFGKTINEIKKMGFTIAHSIKTLPKGDTPKEISEAIGQTIHKFSAFWESKNYNLVFALGDRYEMFAAVSAASPYNISFAHIHAGETTNLPYLRKIGSYNGKVILSSNGKSHS